MSCWPLYAQCLLTCHLEFDRQRINEYVNILSVLWEQHCFSLTSDISLYACLIRYYVTRTYYSERNTWNGSYLMEARSDTVIVLDSVISSSEFQSCARLFHPKAITSGECLLVNSVSCHRIITCIPHKSKQFRYWSSTFLDKFHLPHAYSELRLIRNNSLDFRKDVSWELEAGYFQVWNEKSNTEIYAKALAWERLRVQSKSVRFRVADYCEGQCFQLSPRGQSHLPHRLDKDEGKMIL